MADRYRIPITAITVFGTSALLALSVGIVLYLGFNQAAETTRKLWADQAKTLIDAMEVNLENRLQPVHDQALWVARDITDLPAPAALDEYFFGVLAATPQVAGIAVISTDGQSRRWHRDSRSVIAEDWSTRPRIQEYLEQVKADDGARWREPIFTDTLNSSTLLHDVPLHDASGKFIGIFAQIVTIKELSTFL
ncbi:MAG: PDC sensor domain-containing protein, partial [Gammaproteobacteria bacterium]|nr:PDC sensor domain-containing protein [Gammaproteobacteria bacterium]